MAEGEGTVSSTDQRKAEKQFNLELENMLLALARAYGDPIRRQVQERGVAEYDLAFEAGLLIPAETEMTVYATQKRGRVMRLLRTMQKQQWVRIETAPPYGAYQVMMEPAGWQEAARLLRPWWAKLWDSIRQKRRGRRDGQV
ncbi:MAG: hypothetical protein HY683_07980 [Chloroflexi bacterium]|nr:hypothetical protein [Chloroflexota bacterium]